ncbi:hypothetical protein IRB23M11_00880 [Alkalibacterium sp. m-11]
MAQNSEQSKKKKVRNLVIGIVAGVIVLVAGMGIGITVFGEPGEESLMSRFRSLNEAQATEIAIPLDEFIVNVKGETARSQPIVRMEITVTSMDDDASEIIATDIAKVRDAVIHVVSSQSVSTIMEEKDGEFIIKDQIKDRINQSFDNELIEDVYVTNILIQK